MLRSSRCRTRPACRNASRATGNASTVASTPAAAPYPAVCAAALSRDTLAPPDRAGGSPAVIQYTADATGMPRLSRTSAANSASTGQRSRPSRCGGVIRWVIGPVRVTRPPRPRSAPSPASTSRLSRTSTRDSAQEAAKLYPWNSVKISVVNVW